MQMRPEVVLNYITPSMESILKCTANSRDYLLKDFAEPGFAKQYLEVSLENYQNDGDIDILAHAIRNVVTAQGEIEKLAIQTNSNLQDLHDVLDVGNPPQLNRLLNILAFYTDEVPTRLKVVRNSRKGERGH